MASQLDTYINKQVSIITTDGKFYTGTLKGFDQATNLFLSSSTLTLYNPLREDIQTDSIIIRGDTLVLIGLQESFTLPDEGPPIPQII
ncbi:hypothetical protein SteCoe_28270 [Stentor coeruleus]|uniref:Sm domain-containing protein n=1 Tax=Stentor coeruleus TaxID=5963 RepID=A0A1R2B8M4_9CILI|nr:hypothetical protein SteCoe_28270 [Stentor coeruleus]